MRVSSVLDDYDCGYVIRCHENGREFSADVARVRLADTIKADRQAVPCRRWVWKNPPPDDDAGLAYWLAFAEKLGFSKRHYRYELRK